MVTNFLGEPLRPCAAIARPRRDRPVRRSTHTPVPASWLVVVVGLWHGSKGLAWHSFQGMLACRYSEVVAFRQKLALWPTVVEGIVELSTRGVRPEDVIKVVELTLCEHRITVQEANALEEGILSRVDRCGQWCE